MLSKCMLSLALFDLDNTLYPESSGMDRLTTRLMIEYVARHLKMGFEEARAFRHERGKQYGTTLEWLMVEHGLSDTEDYFSFVHPKDEDSRIARDPSLGPILDSLPMRKAVLTNSPLEHAERVLAKLGARDRFEAVYDIRFNSLCGKPHAEAYRRACEDMNVTI
jgi:putative hydrolase of the HAD superfamily